MVDGDYFKRYYQQKMKNVFVKCDVCGKSFNKTNITKHKKTHLNNRDIYEGIKQLDDTVFKKYVLEKFTPASLKKVLEYNHEENN